MLSDEVIEQLSDILVKRIEDVNTYTILEIAKSLKVIKDLTPTQAQELANVFKYGGDYEKIRKELARITKLNLKDIDKIFESVAKKDQEFAEKFYNYRNVQFIPYEENIQLQRQVKAMEALTTDQYLGFARTLGFTRVVEGQRIFTPLAKAYNEYLEKAIISVAQGKDTTTQVIKKIVDEMSESGIRTIDYGKTYIGKDGKEHYYTRRLDSAVRMNIYDGLRAMRNNINEQFGEEFGANGVEITVHEAPAPDHAGVQGHQFYKEEFDKFQNDKDCVDVNGEIFEHEHNGKDRRSISQYNCRHDTFNIVVGVSEPVYSAKELKQIEKRNLEGFTLEKKLKNGKKIKKHYTLYQGSQMQRRLETEIRKAKDNQMALEKCGEPEDIIEAQQRVNMLSKKYKKLCNESGLLPKPQRTRVTGYKRKSTK